MSDFRIDRYDPRPHRQLRAVAAALRVAVQVVLGSLFLAEGLSARAMIEGNAVVTSWIGSVDVTDASGGKRAIQPRAPLSPSGLHWSTANDAGAFLALSNGTAVGIGASTRLQIIEFQQKTFGPEKAGFDYEPSESAVLLELKSGEIALSCQRLSPVSDFRVRLPHGSLRIHRGIVHLRYDSTGLHIAMIEGNLTYYYPDETTREFISAGTLLRISEQSAQRQQVANRGSLEALSAEAVQLHRATTHASQRVFFKANATTGQAPEPVLVVRPEYFEQASPRPYEFKD